MNVGFLQETKLMQSVHTRNGAGYDVWATKAESWYLKGISVVWRAVKIWQVDNTAIFLPNVVSFLLFSGARRWYTVGSYMPPNDVPDMHCVDQALRAAPKGL